MNRINEIRERLEEATPGPWIEYDAKVYVERGSVKIALPMGRKDAEFIAHTSEDIRFLIDEIERLQEENKLQEGIIQLKDQRMQRYRKALEDINEESSDIYAIRKARNAL